jgi:hypothetical protein
VQHQSIHELFAHIGFRDYRAIATVSFTKIHRGADRGNGTGTENG